MRATPIALVLLLSSFAFGAAQESSARATDITLNKPIVKGTRLVLTGKAPKPSAAVTVQEKRGGQWVAIGKDKATTGKYRLVTPAAEEERRFRAVWKGDVSTTRVAPGVDACGVRPEKPGGGEWSCTLVEEFDGDSLDTAVWTAMTEYGKGDQQACYVNDPRTVDVSGGTLNLTVHRGDDDLKCPVQLDGKRATYVSGSVASNGKFSQQYGRFEARYKSHPTRQRGLQEAFWLWPSFNLDTIFELWPEAGEIDIAETYSQHPDLAIPFLHYNPDDNGGPIPGLNTAWNCLATRGEWHTYTLEWNARQLEIFVDGKSCLVNTSSGDSFHKKFFVVLSQLIGSHDNAYDGSAPLPATMQVDYVRVWE